MKKQRCSNCGGWISGNLNRDWDICPICKGPISVTSGYITIPPDFWEDKKRRIVNLKYRSVKYDNNR